MKRVNWDRIIDSDFNTLCNFAASAVSVKEFEKVDSEARRLVRQRGATYARRLARKALRRRGCVV